MPIEEQNHSQHTQAVEPEVYVSASFTGGVSRQKEIKETLVVPDWFKYYGRGVDKKATHRWNK